MQEQHGNYWKRRGIKWRERTKLQAAFTPYLPPLPFIRSAYRLMDWLNLVGVLRLFV